VSALDFNRFALGSRLSSTDSAIKTMNFLPQIQAFPIAINVEIKQETVVAPTIFNCAFCNQTFQSRKELKEHKNREHNQISEPRQKKSKSESNVQVNYVHHQPKFQCEYCFKGFDQSHRLKQHQISHREPIYECDQVGRMLWEIPSNQDS
jgi:uncharacterized C2H2 Zn-finger protein